MNTERGTYNQVEYAHESGREEGLKKGQKQDAKKAMRRI